MQINDYRQKIDTINLKLLYLLNERAKLSIEIGKHKKANGISVFDKQREQQVIDSLHSKNQGPLTNDAVDRIFDKIIEESRNLQENLNITNMEK